MTQTFEHVTDNAFDAALVSILSEMSPAQILQIPGVYEIVAEELNNEALDRCPQSDEDEDDSE